jgi:protoporphyrinogen oxidase
LFDLGGHITFSHYEHFDQNLQKVLPHEDDWISHRRVSHILYGNKLVPYPFQNNLGKLPPADQERCLIGMIDAAISNARNPKEPTTFKEWIQLNLGDGIAELFLDPYASKVWAISPAKVD